MIIQKILFKIMNRTNFKVMELFVTQDQNIHGY